MKMNIISITQDNTDFRKVIQTGADSQLVVMSIPPGSDIGEEVYADVDQITVIVEGFGTLDMPGEDENLEVNDLVFVPAGTRHNIINSGETDLKLYTIYAPPEHDPHEVQEDPDITSDVDDIEQSFDEETYEQDQYEGFDGSYE